MFCPQCGSEITDASSFCPACGQPLDQGSLGQEPLEQQVLEQQSLNQQSLEQQPFNQQADGAPVMPSAVEPSTPSVQRAQYEQGVQGTQYAQGTQYTQGTQLPPAPVSLASRAAAAAGEVHQQKLAQAESEGLGMKWYKWLIYAQCFLGALAAIWVCISSILGLNYGGFANEVYAIFPGLRPLDILYGLVYAVLAAALIYVRFTLKHFKSNAIDVYMGVNIASLVVTLVYSIIAGRIIGESALAEVLPTMLGTGAVLAATYVYLKKRAHLFTEA